jgi:hypothetical protein
VRSVGIVAGESTSYRQSDAGMVPCLSATVDISRRAGSYDVKVTVVTYRCEKVSDSVLYSKITNRWNLHLREGAGNRRDQKKKPPAF